MESLETDESSPIWGRVFWTVVVLLLLGGVTVAAAPQLRATLADLLDTARQPLYELYLQWTPAALQPLVAKAAGIFLSPWLYLLMALVFLAEKYIPVDRRQPVFSVNLIQDFVAWFAFDGLLRTTVVAGLVLVLKTFYDQYLTFLTVVSAERWGLTARIIAALVLGDFLHWLHHWVRHKVRVFWLFHAIHHSQRYMNMFTDLRVHLVEHFIAKPIFYIPMFMLGLDFEPAFWLTLVTTSYSRIYHANLRTNYGPLKYFMVTPQSHRVHHSILPQHADKNFGVLLSIWDRLLGTQWKNYDEYPPTGIADEGFPLEQRVGPLRVFTNYARQFAYPFRVLWRVLRGRGWELAPPLAVIHGDRLVEPARQTAGT